MIWLLCLILQTKPVAAEDMIAGSAGKGKVGTVAKTCEPVWKEVVKSDKSSFLTKAGILIPQDNKYVVLDRNSLKQIADWQVPKGYTINGPIGQGWLRFSNQGKPDLVVDSASGKTISLLPLGPMQFYGVNVNEDGLMTASTVDTSGNIKAMIVDTKSGISRQIKGRGDLSVIGSDYIIKEKSSDGKSFSVVVGDFVTGHEQKFRLLGDEVYGGARGVFQSRQAAVIHTADGWKSIAQSKLVYITGVFPDHKKFIRLKCVPKDPKRPPGGFSESMCHLRTEIVNSDTLEVERTVEGGAVYDSKTKTLAVGGFEKKLDVYAGDEVDNFIAGKPAAPIATGYNLVVSDPPTWIVRRESENGPFELVNLRSGKKLKNIVASEVEKIKVSADEKRVILEPEHSNDTSLMVDTETGKSQLLPRMGDDVLLSPDFKLLYKQSGFSVLRNEIVCASPTVKVISNDCSCLFGDGTIAKDRNRDLSKVEDSPLAPGVCEKADWQTLAPDLKTGSISEKMAERYLMRFSQAGQYDESQESLMLGILQSSLVEQGNPHVDFALQSIAFSHPNSFDRLMRLAHLEKRMKKGDRKATACRSQEDSKRITTYFNHNLPAEKHGYKAETLDSYLWLKPYWREISSLDAKQRKDVVETIGENLARGAGIDPALEGVMHSKLYYFAKKTAMGLAGEEAKPGTDLAFSLRSGEALPVLLGSEPINGTVPAKNALFPSTEAKYGFYYKALPPVSFPEDAKKKAKQYWAKEWQHGGQKFRAEATITYLGDISKNVKASERPPYEDWEKSGHLSGLIVSAPNMNEKSNDWYKQVYENMDFRFTPEKKVNTVEFMKAAVTSGDASYLYKNAHSDADDRNYMRVPRTADLLTGERVTSSGVVERVYILGLNKHDGQDGGQVISNHELAEWVRNRDKNQPLVSLNSSCNSERSARSEISAVHAKNYEVIAARTEMEGFVPSKDDVSVIMFRGFHERKSYASIRKDLMANKKYAKRESSVWSFPDEPEYEDGIRKHLRRAVDVSTTVKGPKGELIQPSDLVDHECVGACKSKKDD